MCQIAIDAKEIIDANMDEPLSASELAAVLNTDRHSLARRFKKYHGVTMKDYRLGKLRKSVMEMVRTTKLTGYDIAVELYAPKDFVYRTVQMETGMRLTDYRESLGASV